MVICKYSMQSTNLTARWEVRHKERGGGEKGVGEELI